MACVCKDLLGVAKFCVWKKKRWELFFVFESLLRLSFLSTKHFFDHKRGRDLENGHVQVRKIRDVIDTEKFPFKSDKHKKYFRSILLLCYFFIKILPQQLKLKKLQRLLVNASFFVSLLFGDAHLKSQLKFHFCLNFVNFLSKCTVNSPPPPPPPKDCRFFFFSTNPGVILLFTLKIEKIFPVPEYGGEPWRQSLGGGGGEFTVMRIKMV